MVARAWRGLETVGMLLLMPAILLHEATHWLAARGAAEEVAFEIDPRQPAVLVEWREGIPQWRARLAKVAPTLVGLAIAPFVALMLIRSGDLVTVIVGAALWAVYAVPSRGDLAPPSH